MKKAITMLFAIVSIAAITTGCSKGGSYFDRMAALEKQSCSCADNNCAEKAFQEYLAIALDMKTEDARFGEEDTKKLALHSSAIIRCILTKGVSPVSVQQELQKLK